jgi:hypothetical protein
MFRHRRRRGSGFARRQQPRGLVLLGAGAIIIIALFAFFVRQSDELAPAPAEIRVELPDAFKD